MNSAGWSKRSPESSGSRPRGRRHSHEGNGSYAEVLMTRGDERSALSIGVRRDDGVADLRREIAARLTTQ